MKMTYFRASSEIREMMRIEMKRNKRSYQVAISDILTEYFKDRLRLFKLCGIIANKANLDVEPLYLAALSAEHSGELSAMLPQINSSLPIMEALDDLAKKPLDRAWIQLDANSSPQCVHLQQPGETVRTIEVPLKRNSINERKISQETT